MSPPTVFIPKDLKVRYPFSPSKKERGSCGRTGGNGHKSPTGLNCTVLVSHDYHYKVSDSLPSRGDSTKGSPGIVHLESVSSEYVSKLTSNITVPNTKL